jgi:hypothetical protein
VARSRDPGLHGRKPLCHAAGARAQLHEYIDYRPRAYAVVDLRVLDHYDWWLSPKNVWKVE